MKQKNENVFDPIIKMYDNQVKKADKSGDPEKLKKCADLFFKCVNAEMEDHPVTFEDITYLDGYFIFGYGTNSVVHFHIKECPGWLFGIWWTLPDKKSGKKYVSGELFTQYEENIDKFKPSRSDILTTINAYPDDEEPSCYVWDAVEMIKFVREEPYLAFCRDYCGWNYNRQYHTREEAKAKYDEWREWSDNKKRLSAELDKKVLDFVREKIVPLFNECKIVDLGENWSPRYDLQAPYEKNKDLVDAPGTYGWFEKDDLEGKAIMDEFNALRDEGEQLSDQYEFLWFRPIHDSITFYKK